MPEGFELPRGSSPVITAISSPYDTSVLASPLGKASRFATFGGS